MRIRDVEIHLHENEDLSNHIRRESDFFEAPILDYLAINYNEQKIILDIGANIGNHTLYFAKYLKASTIFAFEPLEENFKLLVQNCAPYKNVFPIRVALGRNYSVSLMQPDRRNMGASHMAPNGIIEVPVMPLDHFAFGERVTLIKIDVEGFEPSVLDGAYDTINTWHPDILIEDWDQEYAKYLPGYVLEKAWPEHQTYLYRWVT